MDINAIKQKLQAMQNQGNGQSSNNNRPNYFWKPSEGTSKVRILPSAFNADTPFSEMKMYYGIGSKMMVSPLNWGEKDPIAEFVKQIRQSNSSEHWKMAKALDPKIRIYAPVIVRGQESEGVKLWGFGKMVYESLLSFILDEEIGDYTDAYNGRDIKINVVRDPQGGYPKTTVQPSMNQSPVLEDAAMAEEVLRTQPNPLEVFKPLTFDQMKLNLQNYLNPEGETTSTTATVATSAPAVTTTTNSSAGIPPAPTAADIPASNYSEPASKKTKADEFDDLFNEGSSNSPF